MKLTTLEDSMALITEFLIILHHWLCFLLSFKAEENNLKKNYVHADAWISLKRDWQTWWALKTVVMRPQTKTTSPKIVFFNCYESVNDDNIMCNVWENHGDQIFHSVPKKGKKELWWFMNNAKPLCLYGQTLSWKEYFAFFFSFFSLFDSIGD